MYRIAKRTCDVVTALCALLVCAPVVAITAAVVWFESGWPIFYRARRVGRDGRLFDMYKFRTMGPVRGGGGPRVTAADDPRVTRVGHTLRSTKLNELPQLLNVLKGDMSLVGPRPEDPDFVAHYTAEEAREILSVRPGMTSPAALLFFEEEKLMAAATAMDAYLREIMPTKLRLDLLYVQNRSFLLDLDVLLRTLLAVLPRVNWRASGVNDVLAGPIQRFLRHHFSWLTLDVVVSLLAIGASGAIWRSVGPLDIGWLHAVVDAVTFAVVFALVNAVTGVQRTWWRYAGARDAIELAVAGMLSTALILSASVWLFPGRPVPLRVLLLACALALIGFFGLRYWRRLKAGLVEITTGLLPAGARSREHVLVVGAGHAAQAVVRAIQKSPGGRALRVVGFADDDLWKRGERIHGVSVLGSCADIACLVKEHRVGLILFAIHRIGDEERGGLLAACRGTGARVVVVQDILGRLGPLPEAPSGAEAQQPQDGATQRAAAVQQCIDADVVASWLSEFDRLVSEGRYNTLRQRVRDLRTTIVANSPEKVAAAKRAALDHVGPIAVGRAKGATAHGN